MASVRKVIPIFFFINNLIYIRKPDFLLEVEIYFHRAVVAAHDVGMYLCFCNLVLDAV